MTEECRGVEEEEATLGRALVIIVRLTQERDEARAAAQVADRLLAEAMRERIEARTEVQRLNQIIQNLSVQHAKDQQEWEAEKIQLQAVAEARLIPAARAEEAAPPTK